MDKKEDVLKLQRAFTELRTTTPHKLVETTRKRLQNPKADDNGILVTQGKRCLDIRVSSYCICRALELVNALFVVLEQRGFAIEVREKENSAQPLTYLKLAGEEVQVHLEEKLDRTPHSLTDGERKKMARK